jgi:hypothetical protein
MAHRIGDGNGAALRYSQQRKTLQADRVDHRFKIAHPRVERDFVDLPVGETIAARVGANQRVLAGEPAQDVAPKRALPVVFEMVEPGRRPHQGRTAADGCIGEAHAIARAAVADLLLKVCGPTVVPPGQRGTADREGFDRLGDVLQMLRAELAEFERELAVDLIVGLSEIQMPPVSASDSRRAAMFTPSP